MDALDAFLAALRESTERNQAATRRAQTIRRLRSHGRGYREILGRVSAATMLGVTRDNTADLVAASERLQRAEIRALHHEGVSVEDIAVLCGAPLEDVRSVLDEGAQP